MNSIVIIEDRAHLRVGHFPSLFANLADDFVELGIQVDVLTRRGWALEGTRGREWNLHEAGPLAELFHRVARRAMATSRYFAGHTTGDIGIRSYFGAFLRTIVLIVSARRLARAGSGDPAPIVVVAMDFVPALLSIFGGADRWLIWQFHDDVELSWLARAVEETRRLFRRPAHHVTVAVHDERWFDAVSERLPYFEVVNIPLVASRKGDSQRDQSRVALNLHADDKVALLFGTGHRGQSPEVVVEAFRQRPDWQLVIGGKVCARLSAASLEDWETPPLMFGTFVEESVRDNLFASSDLAVLSFVPDFELTSGTVMDAASLGVPILASSGSLAAGLVEQSGAGEVFQAESSQSLLEALDRIDVDLAQQGSTRLREMYSGAVVCRAHLKLLDREAWGN